MFVNLAFCFVHLASCNGFAWVSQHGHEFRSITNRYNRPKSSEKSVLYAQRFQPSWGLKTQSVVTAGIIAAATVISSPTQWPTAAWADSGGGAKIVGSIQGSGLVFKDTLQIESFEDPKVKGVTLYVSNFQRPLTERLTSNFLADPSYASVACAKTGRVSIADNIARGKNGEQVFDESRSLFFKTLRVQRIYDEDTNTVVYVSYSTRLDKNDDTNKSRFKSSLCALNLDESTSSSSSSPQSVSTSSITE